MERAKKLLNKGFFYVSQSYLISKSISTIVKIDDSINIQVIFNLNSKVENIEEHHSIVMSHFQLNIDTSESIQRFHLYTLKIMIAIILLSNFYILYVLIFMINDLIQKDIQDIVVVLKLSEYLSRDQYSLTRYSRSPFHYFRPTSTNSRDNDYLLRR